jgi:DUF4097 and DUF4098 domain-containing protein YvlB
MDDNVMRVLQMLQEGKISAQEAETLIAALRGETKTTTATESPQAAAEGKQNGAAKEKAKSPKLDFESLGERISQAVSKVQPEKIVKRVQSQLRDISRAGAHFGTTVSQRVKVWTDGADVRPTNAANLPEHVETHTQECHLESGASVMVENPLGNVKITGIESETATIALRKVVWAARQEDLKSASERIELSIAGTDSRLDVRVSAPDFFREGTVDLELRVPRNVNVRASTHFGEVELGNLEGRAEAVTTSGELRLLDLSSDARGETMSGDIRLARILGTATVATQSGDIHAEDVRRGLTANTASGDVRVTGVEGGRVECKSVSGDVEVHNVGLQAPVDITVESVSGDASLTNAQGKVAVKAVSGDAKVQDVVVASLLQTQTVSGDVLIRMRDAFSGTMQVNTVSGDADIYLKDGSNVRVSLSTTSGDLRCEVEAHDVQPSDTLWTGQIGTGAGTLNVQTISGDIHIQRA